MNSSRTHRRDQWHRRISQLTRTVAVIAVVGTLALSLAAARTFAGKTATAAPQRSRSVTVVQLGDDGSVRKVRVKVAAPPPPATSSPSTSKQQQQQQPAPPPPPATTTAPPATVSGGS